MAVEMGVSGFKIIFQYCYPYDKRVIPLYERIAYHNKPLLFHSGILYDGKNTSGNYNSNLKCS